MKPSTWIHQEATTYPQLQQIRDLIQKQPNAIIFNPSPDGYQDALDEAQTAGITTVAIDGYVTDPETSEYFERPVQLRLHWCQLAVREARRDRQCLLHARHCWPPGRP